MEQFNPASYYFSYYSPEHDRIFYARMYSSRCKAIKANGQQCKRKCVIGFEYCSTHLPMELGLTIKKSTLQNAGEWDYLQQNFLEKMIQFVSIRENI